MYKKFLCLVLSIIMIMSFTTMQSYGADKIYEAVNFEGFNITYNTDTVPETQYGTFSKFMLLNTAAYPNAGYYSFKTNTTESDADGDGKCLEMMLRSGTNKDTTYPGISYTLSEGKVIDDVFHFSTAIKVPDYDKSVNYKINVSGPSMDSSSMKTLLYIEYLSNNLIFSVWDGDSLEAVKSNGQYVNLPEGKWFTVDVVYDLAANDVRYSICDADDNVIYEKTFDTAAPDSNISAGVNAVHIYSAYQLKSMPASPLNLGWDKNWYMYLDDMTIQSLDSMVEDTLPDLELSKILFTDTNGESIKFADGTVKANLTAKTNNEKTFDMLYLLAMYDGNELVDVDCKEISIDSAGDTYTATLTVPTDGNHILRAFVWEKNTLKPHTPKSNILRQIPENAKIVILKLDDLRDFSYPHFLSMKQKAEDMDIKMSFGIVADTLVNKGSEAYYTAVSEMDASDNVEIWAHGYTHSYKSDESGEVIYEFQDTLENQIKTLQDCADVLKNKCGIEVHSLGTPANLHNEYTSEALSEAIQYTTLMASAPSQTKIDGDTFIHLWNWMNMEDSNKRLVTVDELKTRYNNIADNAPYVLICGHSYEWYQTIPDTDETSYDRFEEFIDWLKSEKVIFMTPTEYYDYATKQ